MSKAPSVAKCEACSYGPCTMSALNGNFGGCDVDLVHCFWMPNHLSAQWHMVCPTCGGTID